MSADIIQARYDELDTIAKRFQNESEAQRSLMQQVKNAVSELQQGGWEGEGATAFFAEMESEIFPTMQRLDAALESASKVTLNVSHIIEEAEKEAAALFQRGGYTPQWFNSPFDNLAWPDGNTNGTGNDTDSTTSKDKGAELELVRDDNIPLYELNLEKMSPAEIKQAAANLETNGRPIVLLVHGFGVTDPSYKKTADWYNDKYGHLEESQRPVLVRVEWDSGEFDQDEFKDELKDKYINESKKLPWNRDYSKIEEDIQDVVDDYKDANENAETYGKEFGNFIEHYNRMHPESSVNIIAHSLGNRMVMEAIEDDNVVINNYLAVSPAVDRDMIGKDRAFEDVLDRNEVGRIGIVYNKGDAALWLHERVRDEAWGRNPIIENDGSCYVFDKRYNIGKGDEWFGLRMDFAHYNIDHKEVRGPIHDYFNGIEGYS